MTPAHFKRLERHYQQQAWVARFCGAPIMFEYWERCLEENRRAFAEFVLENGL